jgi:hypothetical protein
MADGAAARKILLCGDVGGSLNALYKRFATARSPRALHAWRRVRALRARLSLRDAPGRRRAGSWTLGAHTHATQTLRPKPSAAAPPDACLAPAAAQVNKAAGPFEAIFCVGRFCGEEEGACGDLRAYVDGTSVAPVPTYFVDGLPGAKCVAHARALRWRAAHAACHAARTRCMRCVRNAPPRARDARKNPQAEPWLRRN